MKMPCWIIAAGWLALCGAWAPLGAQSNGAPETWASEIQLGRLALEDGFHERAQQQFERASRLAATREEKAENTVWLVRALLGRGQPAEAVSLLAKRRRWAERTPFEADYAFWAARAYFDLEQYAEASAVLTAFDRTFPQSSLQSAAARLKARCLLQMGQDAAALELFAEFERRHPSDEASADNLLDWAVTLIRLKRQEEARQVLARLVNAYPQGDPADQGRLWLGSLFLEARQLEQARDTLLALASREAARPDRQAEAWLRLAAVYEAQTNFTSAIEALGQGIRMTRDPQAQFKSRIARGKLLIRAGRPEEGLISLKESVRAASADPQTAKIQLEVADILLEQGLHEQAEKEYQHYLEAFTDPEGVRLAWMGKGWSLWGLERYAEAAAAFEKAAERMEEPAAQAQARMKAADALFASRQFTSAQERYLQAARTAPDEALRLQAQYQAGECAARLGDNERAESFLEAVAATGGEMGGRAMLRMAQLDEGDGRWGEALEKYERMLAAFPSGPYFVRALHARGLVRYRLGQFQEALLDFRKVVQDFPNHELAEQAFYMRGWCLYLQGRDAEALEVCQQFLARYPRSSWSADVLFWLGVYAFNHGSAAEAERRFSEIVQTFPSAPMADAALFWAGRSASLQKEYLRALDYYNRLAREYPRSARVPETRFMQGDTLSELGQFAGAILMFDEIILQHPDSGLLERAWGRKGDCQFALGNEDPRRYEEAVKSYRVVLDSPGASLELRLQAEYKSGRCREKMGQAAPALELYMNVVYKYLAEQERGATGSSVWFTRAAFGAASLLEAAGRGEEAMSMYQRVVEADVPAAPEAQQRMEKMRAERAEKP